MKLLAASADACSTITSIRIADPLHALAAVQPGLELRLQSLHECLPADLDWADVLVVQRGTSERAWRLIEQMQRRGGRVVFEIDDLLTDMPPRLVHQAAVQAGLRWLRRGLAAADVVSVSTDRLGAALAPLVRRWVCVPNWGWAPAAPWPPLPARTSGAATLVFASSDHVAIDGVAAALRMARSGVAFSIVAVGPVADDLARAGIAVRRQAPLQRPEFLRWARSQPGALAVIPLGETAFDACKSAIKFFDYAMAGVPVICAARPPYSDVVTDGVTGILVDDTPERWAAALADAIERPDAMSALAGAAREQVCLHHDLKRSVQAWSALLATLEPLRAPATKSYGLGRLAQTWAVRIRQLNRQRLARRDGRGPH